MNHPTTVWYLVQARQDDLNRALARPQLPRPAHRRLRERVSGPLSHLLHARHRQTAARAASGPAGCAATPMGCAA